MVSSKKAEDNGVALLARRLVGDGFAARTHAHVFEIQKAVASKDMASMWVDMQL